MASTEFTIFLKKAHFRVAQVVEMNLKYFRRKCICVDVFVSDVKLLLECPTFSRDKKHIYFELWF